MSNSINMNVLPYPRSFQITNIIHLSDIHIRIGSDPQQARYQEYKQVFQELKTYLQGHAAVKTGNAVCVITGDIFHNKVRLDSFSVSLFNELIQIISDLLPLYIIKGNHDMQQDKPDVPDMIEAVLNENVVKNNKVYYMRKTGHYVVGNVGFGLVDVADTLLKGTSSGKQVDELPRFPDPYSFPDNITTTCALFHGTMISAKLQNYSDSSEGFPVEWLNGYDVAMLGDIHMQQVHNVKAGTWTKKKVTWAYPGSLLQQNFGEELINHGVLDWDVRNKRVSATNFRAEVGYVKLKFRGQFDFRWTVLNYQDRTLENLLEHPLCPQKLFLRLYNNPDADSIQKLKAMLNEHGIEHDLSIIHSTLCTRSKETKQIDKERMLKCNTPNDWIAFIKKCCANDVQLHEDWEKWIETPRQMMFPLHHSISEFLSGKIANKNADFIKQCECLDDVLQNLLKTEPKVFRLKYIEWSWILCFKENCWLNFQDMHSLVNMISGKNGTGKTSILEIIVIALFGEGSPSKTSHACSSSIINRHKPAGDKAYTTLIFELDGVEYKINRSFRINTKDPDKLKDVETLITSDSFTCDLSGNRTTNEWIRHNVCDIEHFLHHVMISQSENADFFNLSDAKQIQEIESSQNIDTLYRFIELIDNAIKLHSNFYATIRDGYENDLKMHTDSFDESAFKNLIKQKHILESNLTKVQSEIEELTAIAHHWGDIKNTDFDDNIDAKLKELKIHLSSFDDIKGESLDTLLVMKGQFEFVEKQIAKLKSIKPTSDVAISNAFIKKYEKDEATYRATKEKIEGLKHLSELTHAKSKKHLIRIRRMKDEMPEKPSASLHDIEHDIAKYTKLDSQREQILKNISKIEKFISKHDLLVKSINQTKSEINDLNEKRQKIECFKHPFNPDCEACRSQLWKLELNDHMEHLSVKHDELSSLELSLDNLLKGRDIAEKHVSLQRNTDHLSYLNSKDIQAMRWSMDAWLEINDLSEKIQIEDDKLKRVEDEIDKIEKDVNAAKMQLANIDMSSERSESYSEHVYFRDNVDTWKDLQSIDDIDNKIQRFKEKDEISRRLKYWERCDDFKSSHDKFNNLKIAEQNMVKEIDQLEVKIEQMKQMRKKESALVEKGKFVEEIHLRNCTLQYISRMFTEYRKIVFNDFILPYLVEKVNAILSTISENTSLYITANHETVSSKANSKTKLKDVIKWQMHYDGAFVPIEKASGFQRFMISFGMRVVFNEMNTKIKNSQLFIDEGFTTFDNVHLAKVPSMLATLKDDFEQILLVSHLEELQNAIDSKLQISRAEGQSSIKFGSALIIDDFIPKKRGRKKKELFE